MRALRRIHRMENMAAPTPRILAFVLLSLSACSVPNFSGPQLQEPPPEFHRTPDRVESYRMFPEREPVHSDLWVTGVRGDGSRVQIHGYSGRIMRADAQDALQAATLAMGDSVSFGGLREFTIDGRRGWGWTERVESPERGLAWIGLRVVVPYDTVSYTLELASADPLLKANPDTLVAIASTFAVGKVTWNVPLLAVVAAGALILMGVQRRRAQERAARLRSVRFVEVARLGEEGEEPGPENGVQGSPLRE